MIACGPLFQACTLLSIVCFSQYFWSMVYFLFSDFRCPRFQSLNFSCEAITYSVHTLFKTRVREEEREDAEEQWVMAGPCWTLGLYTPNRPHSRSWQLDRTRKPQDALAHVQTDGWPAEASALVSGRAGGGLRECPLESGTGFGGLQPFTLWSGHLPQMHVFYLFLDLLTFKYQLGGKKKKREECIYKQVVWFGFVLFCFFPLTWC